MANTKPKRRRGGREPVQVYLAPDDSQLLASLAQRTGLPKAEVLRRGLRSFAAEQPGAPPMWRFVSEVQEGDWPASVAVRHDEVLADTYRGPPKHRP